MSAFLSVRQAYKLHPGAAEKDWLAGAVRSCPAPHTVVFTDTSEGSADMVGKIMQALKFGPGDYVLIDRRHHPGIRARHVFRQWPSIKHCLLFGLVPAEAGLNLDLPGNTPRMAGDRAYMACAGADLLEGNTQGKRELWEAVQKFYDRCD